MTKENHNPITVPFIFVEARYKCLIDKCESINKKSSAYLYVNNVTVNSISHPDKLTEEVLTEFASIVGEDDYSSVTKDNIRDHYCAFRNNLIHDYMDLHSTFFDLFTLVLDDDATDEEKRSVIRFKQHGAEVYKEMVDKFINCGII